MSVFGVILVRIFLHSDWIRRDKKYMSVFIPNLGKYGHFLRSEYFEQFFGRNSKLYQTTLLCLICLMSCKQQINDSNPDCNKTHEIIETLGPNKAYRNIVIPIRILKSCISSIVQPPSLIFQNCLKFVTSFGKRAISSEFIKRTAV